MSMLLSNYQGFYERLRRIEAALRQAGREAAADRMLRASHFFLGSSPTELVIEAGTAARAIVNEEVDLPIDIAEALQSLLADVRTYLNPRALINPFRK